MGNKTQKLYLNDVTLQNFKSVVSSFRNFDGKPAIILSATAFYGEAGGQLADMGVLEWDGGSACVNDVQIEEGVFFHLIKELPTGLCPGMEVTGCVDMKRRRDHMQQHTGQHIISSAFSRMENMKTISSRLGSRVSTIDIDMDQPDWGIAERIESHVNQIIMENRPIYIRYPESQELSGMNLRRTPKVTEDIRVIEIDGFDLTPCGGTHCRSTGEVGLVKITSLERYKGMARVGFVAGHRAVDLVQSTSRQVREVVRKTECQLMELPNLIKGIQEELNETRQNLGILRKTYLAQISTRLLLQYPAGAGKTIISAVQDNLDAPSRRLLAKLLSNRGDVIAFIVSHDPKTDKWMLVLECGQDTGFDCHKVFKEFFFPLGGRGGGKPQHVEGFLPGSIDLQSTISDFVESVKQS